VKATLGSAPLLHGGLRMRPPSPFSERSYASDLGTVSEISDYPGYQSSTAPRQSIQQTGFPTRFHKVGGVAPDQRMAASPLFPPPPFCQRASDVWQVPQASCLPNIMDQRPLSAGGAMATGASMSASGGDLQSRSESDKRNQHNEWQDKVLRMFSNTSVSAKHVWHNMLPGGKSEVQKP